MQDGGMWRAALKKVLFKLKAGGQGWKCSDMGTGLGTVGGW